MYGCCLAKNRRNQAGGNGSAGSRARALATRNSKFLRGDLDNIILALRKDRDRRYASVQEFSEDIHRHLAGLPVSARPDTLSYRAGKFIQRHKAGLAATALIIITLFSATIVTSRQARIARNARATSERRLAEEKRFANSLLNEVQTSLKDIPNAAAAQRILADRSLEHLNILARDAGDDPALLSELARAYINVGYLQAWTLQDNPAALLSYQAAIDLGRKSTSLDPRSVPDKQVLGDSLAVRIESLTLLGRYEEALQTYAELLSVKQAILSHVRSILNMMGVAETTQRYGEMLRNVRQDEEAKAKSQAAVVQAAQAIDLFKNQAVQPAQRVDLSLWYEKQGDMYEQLTEWQKALESYRVAGVVAESVHKEHPEIIQATRNTSSSHWYLGGVLDRLGDYRGALDSFRVSLKTVREADLPSADRTYGEAKYSIVVGKALCKVGEKREGADLVRHGLQTIRNYSPTDKGTTMASYYGAELLSWGAEALNLAGRRDEAVAVSLEAIRMVETTAAVSGEDSNPRLRLISMYELPGDIESGFDAGTKKMKATNRVQLIDARHWYQKSLDTLRVLTERFKFSPVRSHEQMEALSEKLRQCDALLAE